MRLTFLAPLLLLSPVAASQQQVLLRGKVEDGPGRGQYLVEGTSTALTSSTVDLGAFLGQSVVLKGTWNGDAAAPSVDVGSITPAKEIFELPGDPEVGGKVRFAASATPGDRVTFYGALAPGFRPVRTAGVLFLDPASSTKVASAAIPAAGSLEITLAMPSQTALIGRELHAQAVLVSNGQVIVSNPDSKTIR